MKTVAILVENLYQELEVWYPLLRLKEAGHQVLVVGPKKQVYKSKFGYEISADDFDAVIIPGGFAPDLMRREPRMAKFVREIFFAGKPVAAICHGLWMCVSAGILKGKKATCFFAIKDDVVNAGATYVDKEVVVDGNLISSRKPEDLPSFMKELLKQLARKTVKSGR